MEKKKLKSKIRKQKILLVALCFLLIGIDTVSSQDVHFSQWSNTPLLVNPALTGVFQGKLRFSNAYRSQWMGVTQAYSTYQASLDVPIGRTYYQKNYFGLGAVIVQDKAGSGALKNLTALASLSYTGPLDDGDNFFSVGFQAGFDQISFDASKATWDGSWQDNQFDPNYISSTAVEIQSPVSTYPELNAGVLYHYEPDVNNSAYVGAAMYHINGPNMSLFNAHDSPADWRWTAHAGGEKSMSPQNNTFLIPSALFMMQGQMKEITGGLAVKNKFQFRSRYTSYKKDVNYTFGLYYRVEDALITKVAFEYNNFNFGFSYDYTLSSLKKNAGSGNAWELTLAIFNPIRKGERVRNTNKMPKFF